MVALLGPSKLDGTFNRRDRLVGTGPRPRDGERFADGIDQVELCDKTPDDCGEQAGAQMPGWVAVGLRSAARGEFEGLARTQIADQPHASDTHDPAATLEWLIGVSGVPVAPNLEAPMHVVPGACRLPRTG